MIAVGYYDEANVRLLLDSGADILASFYYAPEDGT
jgi:hypothetical protein